MIEAIAARWDRDGLKDDTSETTLNLMDKAGFVRFVSDCFQFSRMVKQRVAVAAPVRRPPEPLHMRSPDEAWGFEDEHEPGRGRYFTGPVPGF